MIPKIVPQINNKGIPSGFPSLDEITGGWHSGDLTVVGSRPGVGKSTFGLNVAVNVAINMNVPVMYFSQEMTNKQIAKRLLYSRANANSYYTNQITDLDGSEWQKIEDCLFKLTEAPVYFNDTPFLSITDFCEKVPKYLSELEVKLIIIDYLQLMRRWPEDSCRCIGDINHIIRLLKETAAATGISVIVLTALHRLRRKHSNAFLKPTLEDFREMNAVEECADMVILLDRFSKERIDNYQEVEAEAEFIVAVNKHGRTGSASMLFDKDTLSFVDPVTHKD